MASRRKFQFAPVIILETRTLTYATSLALMRHAGSPAVLSFRAISEISDRRSSA
jgi:hypothetical protein